MLIAALYADVWLGRVKPKPVIPMVDVLFYFSGKKQQPQQQQQQQNNQQQKHQLSKDRVVLFILKRNR